jgi:hypothetical protein
MENKNDKIEAFATWLVFLILIITPKQKRHTYTDFEFLSIKECVLTIENCLMLVKTPWVLKDDNIIIG